MLSLSRTLTHSRSITLPKQPKYASKGFTKDNIFRAACAVARNIGADRVLKKHVAKHLGCSMGTVNHHWSTMDALRSAIVDLAKETQDMGLLAGTATNRAK
jgi:hypothetical protein